MQLIIFTQGAVAQNQNEAEFHSDIVILKCHQ